jgi:hypothetical protein
MFKVQLLYLLLGLTDIQCALYLYCFQLLPVRFGGKISDKAQPNLSTARKVEFKVNYSKIVIIY